MQRKTVVLTICAASNLLFAIVCETNDSAVSKRAEALSSSTESVIDAALSGGAARIEEGLDALVAAERSRTERRPFTRPDNLPSELAQTFDEGFEFNWVGSAERGAQELAERIGYQFQVEGNRPEADVIASVRGVPTKTVFDVFQDIGLQSAPFATLILDAEERLVRSTYDRRGPTGTTQDFVGSPQP